MGKSGRNVKIRTDTDERISLRCERSGGRERERGGGRGT